MRRSRPRIVSDEELTPIEKRRQAIERYSVAVRISIEGIIQQHPEWTKREVLEEARRRVMFGRNPAKRYDFL